MLHRDTLQRANAERPAEVFRIDEAQMASRTPVLIVCSPLPQVGKTLIARLLFEFFHMDGRPVAAFDVNPDDYALAAQLPEHTGIANIVDTKGQMALFDQLIVADEIAKVVDLGYACFEQFFSVMQEIEFEAEARRRSIAPAALFIAGPGPRSSQAFAALQGRSELPMVPVINSLGPGAAARSRDGFRSKHGMMPLHVPFLAPALQTVLLRSGPLSAGKSAFANRELHNWTRRIFLQFRELELRLLLETLKPVLQLRA